MDGTLTKFRIYAFSDDEFSSLVDTYTLQINPDSYKHGHGASYEKVQSTETAGQTLKFLVMTPQTLSFTFYLDATGVIPGVPNLTSEINRFKKLAYAYDGDIHCPNYLRLVWGGTSFQCRLTSLDIEYTLFKPSGMPLRAKIDVAFEQFQSTRQIRLLAKKNSPDMTHVRTVRPGDTLPLMCFRIYGESNYYVQVARHNRLVDFRHLEPGTRLTFPPLDHA